MIAPGPLSGVARDEQEMDFDGFLWLSFWYEDESSLGRGVRRHQEVVERILNKSVSTHHVQEQVPVGTSISRRDRTRILPSQSSLWILCPQWDQVLSKP